MLFTNDDTAIDAVVNQVNDLLKGVDIDQAATELSRFIQLPLNELPKKLSRFVVLPFKVVLLQIQMIKKLKEMLFS